MQVLGFLLLFLSDLYVNLYFIDNNLAPFMEVHLSISITALLLCVASALGQLPESMAHHVVFLPWCLHLPVDL